MADGRTGVVEVGVVVAAVRVCVDNVGFELDVGVEVEDMGKGLFPSVKSMRDCK